MNKRKLLIAEIESVNQQLKSNHSDYVDHKKQVKVVFSDPALWLAAGIFVAFTGYKIYKGQWRSILNSFVSYGMFFATNRLKKQIASYF